LNDATLTQDTLTDDELFRGALESATLEKFENPEPPKPADQQQQPDTVKPQDQPKPEPQQREQIDAPVPAGRLREESEARRRAERERDELRGQLEAFQRFQQRPQQQPAQQPQKVDLFENPAGFVQQEVSPLFDQFRAELQRTREAMSLDNAISRHGEEKVQSARAALEQGMQRGDPNAWATYQRAMSSHDAYGVITKWHNDREVLNSIGGNLDNYRQRVLEEALKDPEFQKRVIESAKGQASAAGATTFRPAQSKVPTMPSLSNIGAGGSDEQIQEPSDEQLFRAAVSAKRRG
jgi:hypothetical protein